MEFLLFTYFLVMESKTKRNRLQRNIFRLWIIFLKIISNFVLLSTIINNNKKIENLAVGEIEKLIHTNVIAALKCA